MITSIEHLGNKLHFYHLRRYPLILLMYKIMHLLRRFGTTTGN